jgi:hypothetical protein
MAFLGKLEGLAQKVDAAAREAERLGLTTATLILRMARLEIDRAETGEAGRIRPSGGLNSSTSVTAETDLSPRPSLSINCVAIDESGREIHREPSGRSKTPISFNKIR